jgi:hypothetical protein
MWLAVFFFGICVCGTDPSALDAPATPPLIAPESPTRLPTAAVPPMSDGGLFSNLTRDVLGIFGGVGTLATLWALVITIREVRKARTTNQLVADAVNETLNSTRATFRRHAVANAERFLVEARNHVDAEQWGQAVLRLGDLSAYALQLANMTAPADEAWKQLAEETQAWETSFRRILRNDLRSNKNFREKWHEFSGRLAIQINENTVLFGPNA